MSASLLPLFPLPVVLLPGALLPLHVFEPRYRQLLADCLAGDREFGLVFRPDGSGPHDVPPDQVGCRARIEEVEPLPDGRSNIVIRGGGRFRVMRVASTAHPYLVGEVTRYDDEPESADALEGMEQRVRQLFDRVAQAARLISDDPAPVPDLPADAALLSFGIAGLIDLDAPARQLLLASRSALGRLTQLEALLSAASVPIEERAHAHRASKGNGKGPQGPA